MSIKNINNQDNANKEKKYFGSILKELRFSYKMTQEEFAEEICCSSGFLGELERGEKNPSLEMLKKISRNLNVEMVALLKTPNIEKNISDFPNLNLKMKKVKMTAKQKQLLERLLISTIESMEAIINDESNI